MAFNNNSTTDLARFSIGEIQDLSGVPVFYNAGSSKWLQAGELTSSSNLSATTKTTLAAAATTANLTIVMQSTLAQSYVSSGCYTAMPIARISASSVSVVPAVYTATTAIGVGVATSAGFQVVATGQTAFRTNSVSGGCPGVVASNNTTIFSYCFTSATALSAYYTTNGTTWTAGTVTGIPVYATSSASTNAWCSQTGTTYTLGGQNGWRRNGTNTQWTVLWCGARFLLIGPDATNYLLSLSTDGLAWGGDNTTAVLGGLVGRASNFQFYRNGNNCYLNIGTRYRYSTDGGVTWAASTFAAAPDPTSYFLQTNQTDPAKLVILTVTSTVAYYSADSGATWSANRPLPLTSYGGVAYRGSTVVCSNATNDTQVSTDNGTTWVTSTTPIGTLGTNTLILADANRFYLTIFNQKQILTSSDGVTWTIVTTPVEFMYSYQSWTYGGNIISFDSNTIMLYGSTDAKGRCFVTTDGGVTWAAALTVIGSNGGDAFGGGNAFLTPDAGGVAFPLSATGFLTNATNAEVLKTDVTAGGAFYRTGASAISPIRSGALSYVRVG